MSIDHGDGISLIFATKMMSSHPTLLMTLNVTAV